MLVGDGGVGKTSLNVRYTLGVFPAPEYIRTGAYMQPPDNLGEAVVTVSSTDGHVLCLTLTLCRWMESLSISFSVTRLVMTQSRTV